MIHDIYKLTFMRDSFNYVGTLRNEKKFNINDNIFVACSNNEIFSGKIVGVELLPIDNPEYKYKICIPKGIIKGVNDDYHLIVNCEKIFNTIDEAKQSAYDNLEKMYNLQKKEIYNYFNKFK